MASMTSLYAPALSFDPFTKSRKNKPSSNTKRHHRCVVTYAARKDQAHNKDYSGRIVDENMIVLRKRIHEMKMIENNYEPPTNWMDWEKQIYSDSDYYGSLICDVMYHLQSYLMETRPSLVLSIIAVIALSVPTSTAVVVYNLMDLISKGLLQPGIIHLG